MSINKKTLLVLVLLPLIVLTFLLPNASLQTALGQNYTLPTFPPPTNTPGSGGGGGGGGGSNPVNPPPAATNTPAATATSTLIPVTIAPTPEGGFQPTAVACSSNPTVQARNRTNVRPGPGLNYAPPVAQLVFLEVRPILARAEFAPWWLIALDDGTSGWVADEVVVVNGNIAGVPIANPPALDGATPTPGAPWQPTPNPTCPTLTPTATATPSPEPSATHTPAPTETAVPTETADATLEAEAADPTPTLITGELSSATSGRPEETAAENTDETETDEAGTESTESTESEEIAEVEEPTIIEGSSDATAVPTAEPLTVEEATSSATTPILPIAGGILVLGGIAFAIWRRFNTG